MCIRDRRDALAATLGQMIPANLVLRLRTDIPQDDQPAKTAACSATVSYTHLDVYKRQGQITSTIVKNAMLASADEINAKFEAMPMTFAQVDVYKRQPL